MGILYSSDLLFCAVVDTESTVPKTLAAFTQDPSASLALGSDPGFTLVYI